MRRAAITFGVVATIATIKYNTNPITVNSISKSYFSSLTSSSFSSSSSTSTSSKAFTSYSSATPSQPSTPNDLVNISKGNKYKVVLGTSCHSNYPKCPNRCGHDAFFTYQDEVRSVMGVADGVGGWIYNGVDPSFFSNALVSYSVEASKNTNNSPTMVLREAFDRVKSEKKVKNGSSTACYLQVNHNTGKLDSANLGDSSYFVFRSEKVVFQAKVGLRGVNFPRQLGVENGNGDNFDQPEVSITQSFDLKDQDLIVVATDGFFDNVDERRTNDVMNKAISSSKLELKNANEQSKQNPDQLVKQLDSVAQSLVETAKAARRKPDDTTVIVALILEESTKSKL